MRVYNQSFLMMCKFSAKIVFLNKNTIKGCKTHSAGNWNLHIKICIVDIETRQEMESEGNYKIHLGINIKRE